MKTKMLLLLSLLFCTSSFASLRECRSIDTSKYNEQRKSCFVAFTDPTSSCSSINIDRFQDEFEACSLAEFYAAHSRIGEDSECSLIDQSNYLPEYLACLSLDLKDNSECRSIDEDRYSAEFIACVELEKGQKLSVNSSRSEKTKSSENHQSSAIQGISSRTK